jgi:hypothetical protein
VLQAAVAGALGLLLLALPGTVPAVVGTAFLLSMVPTIVWTAAAWARHPQRGALALALVRLPVYAIWRVAVAFLAVSTGRRGAWQRSPRHST